MIQMDNCLLALNHINKSLPKTFENFFQYSNYQHNHCVITLEIHQVKR